MVVQRIFCSFDVSYCRKQGKFQRVLVLHCLKIDREDENVIKRNWQLDCY